MMNKSLLVVLMSVLAVSGCNRNSAGEGESVKNKAQVVASAEPVAAVLVSGPPVAKLGFVLMAKPVVGTQVELHLELTATEGVPALYLRAEADGLALDPDTAQIGLALEPGKSASHELRLTPAKEGLAEVTVHLRTAPDSAQTVYSIPVLIAAAGG